MAEPMGDAELARLRATVGERGSLFPPRQVAALLARLDAAEREAQEWRERCERAEGLLADLLEEDDDD